MVLGDVEHLQVRADVDEQNAPRLQPGQTATAYLKGDTTQPIALRFVRIEPYRGAQNVAHRREHRARGYARAPGHLRVRAPEDRTVYVGQQVDLFVKTKLPSVTLKIGSVNNSERNL